MEIINTLREELNGKKLLKTLFGIDARALGIYRIVLAICILIDLIIRMQDIRPFYTDEGIVPSNLVPFLGFGGGFWTFHTWATTYTEVACLMGLAAVFAFLLLIGYRTRLMTILSWVMLLSIQNRNLLIWQGCDELLRLMAFWGMLLPLNARYAIDNIRNSNTRKEGIILSGATAGLLLQVAFVYLFTAILKSGSEWSQHGNAIWYALNLDEFAKPPAHFLLHYPDILPWLGMLVLNCEFLIPVLFFLPVFNQEARLLGIFMLVSLHIGLGLCLLIGPFPVFNILLSVVFIPSMLWDRFDKWISRWSRPKERMSELKTEEEGEALDEDAMQRYETERMLSKGINYVSIAAIIFCLYWNLSTIPELNLKVPNSLEKNGRIIGLDQKWDMFSPYPMREDGWYVMPAVKRNGDSVDLWRNGGPISWKKPEYVINDYKNFRWQKLMRRVLDSNFKQMYLVILPYITHTWNETHADSSQHIKTATLFFMEEKTQPPGVPMKVERKFIFTNIVGKGKRKKLEFGLH